VWRKFLACRENARPHIVSYLHYFPRRCHHTDELVVKYTILRL
jgi:hypothetical protein